MACLKNIEVMRSLFGDSPGNKCKGCSNLRHIVYHGRSYYKCDCYGISNSVASDFRLNYDACGLFNIPYNGTPAKELKRMVENKHNPLDNYECDGQLDFNDIWKEKK